MYYNSAIINTIIIIIRNVKETYQDSAVARIIRKLAETLKRFFHNSSIFRFFIKKGFFERVWEYSGIYSLLNGAFNIPSKAFRRFYLRVQGVFDDSLFISMLRKALNRFELILGLLLAVVVVIPDSRWHNVYSIILIIAVGILFFVKTIIYEDNTFCVKRLSFPLVVFMLSVLMATITSLFPRVSMNYFILYAASFLLLLIVVSSINSVDDINHLLEVLLGGVAITALYGLWQWKVVGIPVDPSQVDIRFNQGMSGRLYSTMGNANVYGELLVLTLPFFLALILNVKSYIKKAIYLLMLLPILAALLLTGSRSAWAAFFGSLLIFVFFKNKKLVPFLLVLGIVSFPFLPDTIRRRVLSIVRFNDSSTGYRKLIFGSAWNMSKEYWLTGVGLGTDVFINIFKRYAHPDLKTVAHTHNFYLQLWLESGLIALLSFLWFIARLVRDSILNIARRAGRQTGSILAAGISSIAGIMVMGLVEHIWFYNRIMIVFWVVVGIMLSAIKILNKGEVN